MEWRRNRFAFSKLRLQPGKSHGKGLLGLAGSRAVAAIEAASVVTDRDGHRRDIDGCVIVKVVATAGGNGAVTLNICSFDGSLLSLSPFTSSMGTGFTEANTSSIVSVIGCCVAAAPPPPLLASRRSCPCDKIGDSEVGAAVEAVFIAKTADGGAGVVGNVGKATVTVAVPGCARWKAAPRDVGLDLTGDCSENRTACCGGVGCGAGNLEGATNVEDEDVVAVETGDFFAPGDPLVRASCRMDVLTGEVRDGGGKDGGFITAGCGSGGGSEAAAAAAGL